MIFISNGNFEEPESVADTSSALRLDIDNVFPVVVSSQPDIPTLKRIASPDAERHVYLTTSYNALDQYRNKMAVDACVKGRKRVVVMIC